MLPPETIRHSIEERLFGAARTDEPAAWSPASGGLSGAAVWRVGRRDEVYAVRRWWAGIDPKHVAWITSTLRDAESSGLVFVAAPLWNDEGGWPLRDAHEGFWEAAPWKPGAPLSELPYSAAVVAEAATGLARLHRRWRHVTGGPPAGRGALHERMTRLQVLAAQPTRLDRQTEVAWPELTELARRLPSAAARALAALEPYAGAEWEQQVVHGDARPEHFLLDGGRLTGLIDFGAMRRDTVLADVARLAGELSTGDAARRDELVAFYESAAQQPIDRRAVAALDLSGAVLSAENWRRWLTQKPADAFDAALVRQRLRSIGVRLAS